MATLIRPPALDESKSAIENVLELTHLNDIDPNLYTNTRPLWHPPGARGIYGGAAIAQCLVAAQKTVPEEYTIHSMHCYFVLAGNAEIPVVYHVERVRDGKSFITRTVQARQRAKVIFTATMSFTRASPKGVQNVEHHSIKPHVPPPNEEARLTEGGGEEGPFHSQRLEIINEDSSDIASKRVRTYSKAKGRISDEGGHQAHVSALAYMSDSYFIGTVARAHRLWRFSPSRSTVDEETLKRLLKMDDEALKKLPGMTQQRIQRLRNADLHRPEKEQKTIGMMVSLDHTIFFHEPRAFRADEWLLSEMETPWSGDGRGLVFQKIFTQSGVHVATCIQEGVVRLKQQESKL